tara:strand:+ start:12114 stop:12488 length:375 start_codon:yes stop_codon:yes gene_type:complete
MGNPLFGVNISGLINANIGPGVNDAVLTKTTNGTRNGGQLTGGTNPTTTTHACKGFVDLLNKNRLEGSVVQDTDSLVAIIGDSIAGGAVPTAGDRVTIVGKEYNIIEVTVDPALAVYNCVGRAN